MSKYKKLKARVDHIERYLELSTQTERGSLNSLDADLRQLASHFSLDTDEHTDSAEIVQLISHRLTRDEELKQHLYQLGYGEAIESVAKVIRADEPPHNPDSATSLHTRVMKLMPKGLKHLAKRIKELDDSLTFKKRNQQ